MYSTYAFDLLIFNKSFLLARYKSAIKQFFPYVFPVFSHL